MCNSNSVAMIQRTGSKVYGPPDSWSHASPSYRCELYIKNLPKDLNEEAFVMLLKRFGFVYQFRLMTDSKKIGRGYAFVRYSIELDALAAMELINRYFLPCGERLRACKSLNKRSLYVANLPKELLYKDLYKGFMQVFPRMRRLVLRSDSKIQNRGFAFIEFSTHEDALEAKRRAAMGSIELWGIRLKIVWAQMQPAGIVKSKNTLIVNGLNNECYKDEFLKQMHSLAGPADIKMIELFENQGIVSFNNSSMALKFYSDIKNVGASDFSVEWAKSGSQSWIRKRVDDFCAELRLICIANGWQIPIILFGKNYRKHNLQYGAVLLADGNSNHTLFLMEVVTVNVYDIQSTMCEVVVGIINKVGGLPTDSMVYKVVNRSAHQVCCLNELMKHHEDDRVRDWNSIHEMGFTLRKIALLSDEQILSIYRKSFLPSFREENKIIEQMLPNCVPVYPKYRNKSALIFNMNDSEIVLVLRDNTCDDILPPNSFVYQFDENTVYLTWKRKPDFLINYIDAGSIDFYHPSQRINVAPVWIPGHTYRHSLKNFLL